MRRGKTVTVAFSREDEGTGEEFTYSVKCRVTAGAPATRLDPEDPGEVEILDITPVDGGPGLDEDDLSHGELETIEDRAVDAACQDSDDRGYED